MDSWISQVASLAPTIGAALGGPLGGLAGNFLAKTLGVTPGAGSADEMSKIVAANDPEIALKIQAADHDFKIHLADLGIQESAINQQDRADARKREIALGGWSNPALAAIVIAGFFAVVGWVLSGQTVSGTDAGLIGTVVGYASAKADQVVSYYFGSSKDHSDAIQIGNRNG